LTRGIWSGQIASHSDRKEVSDTARLLRTPKFSQGGSSGSVLDSDPLKTRSDPLKHLEQRAYT